MGFEDNLSILKILLLYRLLLEKDCTKNEIIDFFKENEVETNKQSISNYIKVLIENNIEVVTLKNKNRNVYSIKKPNLELNFSKKELQNFKTVKKNLIFKKDFELIKKTLTLFLKTALHTDITQREALIDFGYFSTLNWGLILELKKQISNKTLIKIEYISKDDTKIDISLYPVSLSIGNFENTRLYLNCVFLDDNKLSKLPVDKIFLIKKVTENPKPFKINQNSITYKISKKQFLKIEKDDKEEIIEKTSDFITLKRPLDDEFYIVQRLLSFCPELYYISDEKIKAEVIKKLNLIKELYAK